MYKFECGTLVPGCPWHTQADSEAEVVRRVVDHLHSAHNEDLVRPELVARIKERVVASHTTGH